MICYMVVTPEGKRHTLILVTIEHKYTYTLVLGEVLRGVSPYAKLELSIRNNRGTWELKRSINRVKIVTYVKLTKVWFVKVRTIDG